MKLLVKPIFILGLIIFLLGLTINLSYPQTKEIVIDPEEVVGKYVAGDPNQYLDIKKDGIFYLKEKGKYYSIVGAPETTGKWEIEKDKIIFFHPLGIVTRGKIEPNVIIDEEGKIWFKEGSIPQSIIIANAQEVPVANSFRFPLDGDWSLLWQDFGKWNNQWNGYHLGEDVGREDADAKEYAVYPMADGVVKFADVVLGYTVIIEHKLSDNDPDGDSVCSVYYHMKRPGEGGIKLKLNEVVYTDNPIGYVSGKWEDHQSSPHLHFGIRKGHYETGKDPRTGFWYYPGYTVIKKDSEVQKNPDDPIHKQILADWFNPSTDPKNGTGFIERHVTQIGQITEISSSKDYFPLDEGRRWEYQTYVISQHGIKGYIGPGSKTSGKRVCSNFPQRELEGKKVTPIQIEDKIWDSVRTSFDFYVKDQNGIYQFAHQEPEDTEPKISHFYEIKYPIKVGNNWQETVTSTPIELVYHYYRVPGISIPVKNTIESIDDVVTVPAGTFKECLKIKSIGFAEKVFEEESPLKENVKVECYIERWFALNVGLIKSIFKEKKTISTILQITEFDLKFTMQLETFK